MYSNLFNYLSNAHYRFEEKYHPTKSVERKRFIRNSMRKRLRVFLDLWEEGYIDKLDLQIAESTAVLKLLDRGKLEMIMKMKE